MEVTAMTSADPVEVTAMRTILSINNSPGLPRRREATTGGTKPDNNEEGKYV
jgi:hypothetical protein